MCVAHGNGSLVGSQFFSLFYDAEPHAIAAALMFLLCRAGGVTGSP